MHTHIEIPTEDEAWPAFDEFMANWAKTIDLEMALLDPERVFESPQDVLDHPGLSREARREILERWKYEEVELAVAEDEGMGGGAELKLTPVIEALEALGREFENKSSLNRGKELCESGL